MTGIEIDPGGELHTPARWRRLLGHLRLLPALAVALLLAWSFWRSAGWLELCAGLAMFLFGMQMLEEGLRKLAGSKLEQWLARSTGTPVRGLLFGIGGTALLQSSTLVSLLTIAFVSTGLIQLAGGIAIIFGANLGATSGIWLLALAGQNFSLSPLALPLLVFGVLAGFLGERSKAAGRVVLGIAFIFLGIDQITDGFSAMGGALDLEGVAVGGISPTLLFAGIGMAATVVLQSSHATLILTLAGLGSGHLQLDQALALAIGANVGSSISTAVVGMLGGNRSGQRLALAHVLFKGTTALLALLLLAPLSWLVQALAGVFGFGGNALLQLALFHSLFNGIGVAFFWPWQEGLARFLTWLRPEPREAQVQLPEAAEKKRAPRRIRARHLNKQALDSVDAASAAVAAELRHLGRLCLEVICHALYLPVEKLHQPLDAETTLEPVQTAVPVDAEALYQHYVKGVYADLLSFMGRLEQPLDADHQRYWRSYQVAALQLVNAVKDAKHLQKNIALYLFAPASPARDAYLQLWRQLFTALHGVVALGDLQDDAGHAALAMGDIVQRQQEFDTAFQQRLFGMVRRGELDGIQTGSLMNDLGYVNAIVRRFGDAADFTGEPESLRELRRLAAEDVGTEMDVESGPVQGNLAGHDEVVAPETEAGDPAAAPAAMPVDTEAAEAAETEAEPSDTSSPRTDS